MKLMEYQAHADETAFYPGGILYTGLGLCGESGEYADKLKKIMRDDNGEISDEKRTAMLKELGDVLWYVAQNARELNSSIEEVAVMNVNKLRGRVTNNTINGSGDNR